VHGVPRRRLDHTPVSSPIYQSSTFINPVGQSEEVLYTRYGNNPNQIEIGEKLAVLEGAERGLFVASGMGATALAHLAVLRPGDHLVSSAWIYGGTRRLFTEQFTQLGIEVSLVDPSQKRAFKNAIRKNTRAVFVEMVTNPLMRVLDLEPLAKLAKTEGFALLVDSTFASPVNCRPLEHGADVVIHSVTKYLNGHSDIIAGAVAGTEQVVEEVRHLMQVWGQALDPHAAWLIDRGLKTLALRVQRQNASGLAFAQWGSNHEQIAAAHYPGLEGHPDRAIANRLLSGCGGVVGLEVKGGARQVERMLRRLRLAQHAPSLGGVETLVSEPRLTSHASLTPAERAAQGIPDGFVRVSLGIEDVDDIIADFEHALAA
jgi:cystathionine beta-lyase/cystathionine gamma-synthase